MSTLIVNYFNDSDKSLQLSVEKLKILVNQISLDNKIAFGWINFIALNESAHTEMNNQYLQHNYPTDVITFDFSENNHINGEIYFNPNQIEINANEYSVSIENEAYRVFVHGLLHLLGMDDATENERNKMRETEDKYLNSFM